MLRSRRAHAVVLAVAVCVLAATLAVTTLVARNLIRRQMVSREAEALYAVTLMEQLDAARANGADLGETDEQLGFDAAVLASRLRGMMGIRFFDPSGRPSDTFPANIHARPLAPAALQQARDLHAHGAFRPDTPLSEVFIYLPEFATGPIARVPTLEVTVPLHRREGQRLAGVAQFVVEGASLAAEFARLDRHLAGMAGAALVAAAALLAALMQPAFRQVNRLHALLTERNERLRHANEELALAARSAALGAVSGHLMHGLKNPLASLSQFVRSAQNGAPPAQDDWQDALTAARRMQALVEQTLEVLADAGGGPGYDVTLDELLDGVRKQAASLAQSRGVSLAVHADADIRLPSRTANLLHLILRNLLENALQATPAGKGVSLRAGWDAGTLLLAVEDEGPGFPSALLPKLFLPCKSTREGGSGLGLAISKQLAEHLGAGLGLEPGAGGGCRFVVRLPLPQTDAPAPHTGRPVAELSA